MLPRWLLPLLLGAFATLVAALGSWIPSLWGDEVASLLSAERPLPSLFMMLGQVDAVHGTYYLGLHAWIDLFGTSPFALRFPSALAAGLCTAAVVLIGLRLSTASVATAAGLLCAVLPRVTYMGEEARSFAFSAAIAAWLTLLFIDLLLKQSRKRMRWAAYGALLAVGSYVFLYLALLMLAHALLLAWSRPGRAFARRWIITVALAGLAAVPLLYWAAREGHQIAYLATDDEITPHSIFVGLWFGTFAFAVLAWTLIVVAIIGTIVSLREDRTQSPAAFAAAAESAASAASGASGASRWRAPRFDLVAACWLFVPSTALVGIGLFAPVFTGRYLSFCAPAAAMLLACGLTVLFGRRPAVLWVSVALVMALAVPVYLSQREPYSKNNSDWAEISATLGAHARPGDAVAFDESARPSRRPRLAMHAYPAGFVGLRDITLNVPFSRNTTWYDSAYTVAQAATRGRFDGVQRVWLIEYAEGRTVDSSGLISALAQGFAVTTFYRQHASVIYELERTSGPRTDSR
ncbi:glycosyltransferase family 39 protein [Glaciibacter psychrotolerans]